MKFYQSYQNGSKDRHYQMFHINSQNFAADLYARIKATINLGMPEGWISARLIRPLRCSLGPYDGATDAYAIEALASEILLLEHLAQIPLDVDQVEHQQKRTIWTTVRLILRSTMSRCGKTYIVRKIRHLIGMDRPSNFYCFCQPLTLPVDALAQHFLLKEKMKPEKLMDILEDHFHLTEEQVLYSQQQYNADIATGTATAWSRGGFLTRL